MNFPEITSHQIIAQILKKYTFPKITLSHHKPLDLHPSTLDPKTLFLRFLNILTTFSSFLLYLCHFFLHIFQQLLITI